MENVLDIYKMLQVYDNKTMCREKDLCGFEDREMWNIQELPATNFFFRNKQTMTNLL